MTESATGASSVDDLVNWRRRPAIASVVLNSGAAVIVGVLAIVVGVTSSRPRQGCGELESGNLGRVETCIYGGSRPHVGQVTQIGERPEVLVFGIAAAIALFAFAIVCAVVKLRPGRPTAEQLAQFHQRVELARAPLLTRWQQCPSPENTERLRQFDAEVARVSSIEALARTL